MAITEYTTPDNVRATLGVTDDELEDDVITNPICATLLDEALLDIVATLPDNFAAVQEQNTKTAAEERFLARVQAWATYFVADHLLGSVAVFSPQTMKSEKDAFERVVDPFEHLRTDIPSMLDYLKGKIEASYAILFPGDTPATGVTRTLVVNAGLGVDPVTG